ncbi:MAG: thiolase domain-containing protein [Thaumarchaeota archaeon]|nr:thiolase domain-containing protein [Nitrososphaerota archaeon]
MKRVIIAGAGLTKVGDHWNKSILDLAVDAATAALKDAGIATPDQIIIGNMFSGFSSSQESLGAMAADALRLWGVPAFKVESSGASGSMALHVADSLVKSGQANSALVIGVEKMRDLEPSEAARATSLGESSEYVQFFGISQTALGALITQLYMQEYEVTRDELSCFPVIAHKNAVTSEHAQFRKAVSIADVSRSMPVSDPLRLLDCAPVGDGAAAVVLSNDDGMVKDPAIEIAASAASTDSANFYQRDDMLEFMATRRAVTKALSLAGISVRDIDFAEINDSYSAVAGLSVEALGLSKMGEGARDARDGKFDIKGKVPISTYGGLKGRGNPVGATGIYQIVEAYHQLVGKAKANQVVDAKIGLTHNMGGIDSAAVVHILRRIS